MGVKGLWQLLQATGHPVTVESLEGKVLAVDVSIWLHQTLKGMRDKDGNPLPNAHLLGLFHRVCKLLFYRIKPIFVFDGGVPALKKQTMIARRQRKEFANNKSERASKDLLENLLKHHALKEVLGAPPGGSTAAPVPSTSQQQKPDLFELPPIPVSFEQELRPVVDEELAWENRMDQRSIIHAEFQNLEDIDIHSDDFKNLPPEIQHEILTDMRENDRLQGWAKLHEMPQETNDFSRFQLERLKKRSFLAQRLDNVRKEITARNSGEIAHILTGSQAAAVVESCKVASEDTAHYILIKGISKVTQEEERTKLEQGSATLGGTGVDSENTERKDAEKKILEMTREGRDIVDILKSERESKIKQEKDARGNVINEGNETTATNSSSASELQTNKSEVKHETDDSVTSAIKPEVTTIDSDGSDETSNKDIINLIDEDDSKGSSEIGTKQPIKDVVSVESSDEECEIVKVVDKETGESLLVEDDEMAGGFIREESDDEVTEISDKNINGLESVTNTYKISSTGEKSATEVPVKHTQTLENSNSAARRVERVVQDNAEHKEDPVTPSLKDSPKVNNEPQIKVMSSAKGGNEDKILNLQTEVVDVSEETDKAQAPVGPQSDSSSDEENFIEIKINPEAAGDDELFPASIFMTENNTSSEPVSKTMDNSSVNDDLEVSEVDKVISDEEKDVPEDEDVVMPDDLQVVSDANEFEGLSREELVELQTVLMSESSQLNQERGKQQRMAASVTEQMTLEAQDMLRLFGVPFLVSPMEAEAQCAYLDHTGLTEGSITDDSDIWLFGGQRVYKNFFNQNKHVEFFKMEDIARQLLLDKEKLISLALICGSDYTEGIEGLGPVHGMEILQEFPGEGMAALKNFKEWWDETRKQLVPPVETKLKGRLRKVILGPGFPSQEVFQAYLHPEVDESKEKFSWGKPDLDLLRQFTKQKFGWNKTKSDEELLPVMKQVNSSQTQQHITSFFMPTQLENEPRKLKSRRVKRVLKRLRNPDEEPVQNDSPVKKNSQVEAKNGRGRGGRGRGEEVRGGGVRGGRGQMRGRGGRGRGSSRGNKTTSTSARNMIVNLSESSSDDEQSSASIVLPDVVDLSESDSDSDDLAGKPACPSNKGKAPLRKPMSTRGQPVRRAKRR